MLLNEFKDIHSFIENRGFMENKINPLEYKVPNLEGIIPQQKHKTIKEVRPDTLKYILYKLHNIDNDIATDTLMALLYYYKFRDKKLAKMETAYRKARYHYIIKHTPYTKDKNMKKGDCIYLIRINIGRKTLYKVGTTSDIHTRMINLQSNISKFYPLVSVGINIKKVIYCNNNKEIEETLLSEIRSNNIKKHKFFFDGHTEAFQSDMLLKIFYIHTKEIISF